MMLPRFVHFIWLGADVPEKVYAAMDQWRAFTGDRQVHLHRDDSMLMPQWQAAFDAAINVRTKADLLRYSVLRQMGGWYSDIDIDCHKPLDEVEAECHLDGAKLFTLRACAASSILKVNVLACSPAWQGWELLDDYIANLGQPPYTWMYGSPMLTRLGSPMLFTSGPDKNYGLLTAAHPVFTPENFRPRVTEVSRVSKVVIDLDIPSTRTADLEERATICAICPDQGQGETRRWCTCKDDNGTGVHNCPRTKGARWQSRICSYEVTCDKWRNVPSCPICSVPDPLRGDYVAAFQDLADQEFKPPKSLARDGIVYAGEGRYWPMLVAAVKMLRRTGCTLPVQVWHREPVGSELDGLATLVDAKAFNRVHLARKSDHFASKDYAISHSGFRRVLYLDADAYCVKDPTPLFELLDGRRFVYWANLSGFDPRMDYSLVAPLVSGRPWVASVQGGHYLVDCAAAWKELVIQRWYNNHADFWWKRNRNCDEDGWRLALTALQSPCMMVEPAAWRRCAFVCSWKGEDYIVHRCSSKALPNRPQISNAHLPREAEMLELFSSVLGNTSVIRGQVLRGGNEDRATRIRRMIRDRHV